MVKKDGKNMMTYLVFDIGCTDSKYAVMDDNAELVLMGKKPNS